MSKAGKAIYRHNRFLKDVVMLSLTSFGGPQAHLSLMHDQLVVRRNYLSEDELLELNALCNILPGPTSTQTITAVGMKLGGPWLAFFSLLIWILPATIIMTFLAISYDLFLRKGVNLQFLRFIQPIAIGFVAVAGYRLVNKLIKTNLSWGILLAVVSVSMLVRSPWVYPVVLLLGAIISNYFHKNDIHQPSHTKLTLRWGNLYLYFGILIAIAISGNISQIKPLLLFENTFRYGSLIFGGGHVLIPMMYEQLVLNKAFLTSDAFLTGFGLAQAVPGPVFSFASYADALAMSEFGTSGMILGSAIGAIGIFLPGTLLIFLIYPAWKVMREKSAVKRSLEGLNAAATGLVVSAAFLLMEPVGYTPLNINVAIITFGLVEIFTISPKIIILLGLLAGGITLI